MLRALLGVMSEHTELRRGIVVGKRRYAGLAWTAAALLAVAQVAVFAAAMGR
jgi:hypothetical protein